MSKKMKVFIIVCAVVFLAGLAATIAGMALHGWKDFYRIPGDWHIGMNTGDSKTMVFEGESAKFDSLDVDMTLCQVEISQGSGYNVELTYDSNMPKPVMTIENGRLTVKSGDTLRLEGKDENLAMLLKITVPKGAILKEGILDVNLGQLKLADVSINNLNISMDAGELTAQNLSFDKAEMDLNFCSGDVEIKGSESDYTYKIDNEISTISVDDREVGDMEKNGAVNGTSFNLSCDFSDVEINFTSTI